MKKIFTNKNYSTPALYSLELIVFTFIILFKTLLLNYLVNASYLKWVVIASNIGTALILVGSTLLFKRKTRFVLLNIINGLVSFIVLSNAIFFRYYDDVISTPVFKQLFMVSALQESMHSLFRAVDFLIFIDVIILIPITILYIKKRGIYELLNFTKRTILAIIIVAAGFGLVTNGFIKMNRAVNNTALTHIFDHGYFVSNVGILNFHAFDIYFAIKNSLNMNENLEQSEMKEVRDVLLRRNASTEKKYTGFGEGMNLIVVQVEAMHILVINEVIDGNEIRAVLNEFINKSVYFDNFHAQTAQGNTSDAEFLLNTSLYPLPAGGVYFQATGNEFKSLPKLLNQRGYYSVSMHPYKASYWNRAIMHPVLGFNKFYSLSDYVYDERVGWGLSDESFFRQSVEIFEEIDKPFYSLMITLSSHHPFTAFQDYEDLYVGEYEGTFLGNYYKSMHYADMALGRLFENLEESGLMDNSIIVIYGDHSGVEKHRVGSLIDDLDLVDNVELGWLEMTKVPLFIYIPGFEDNGLRTVTGGQIDLLPTIGNIMGFETKYTLGKDLLNIESGYAIFRNGSITDGEIAYIQPHDKCYYVNTGEEVEKNEFEEMIKKAQYDLSLSDKIIRNDLIRQFVK